MPMATISAKSICGAYPIWGMGVNTRDRPTDLKPDARTLATQFQPARQQAQHGHCAFWRHRSGRLAKVAVQVALAARAGCALEGSARSAPAAHPGLHDSSYWMLLNTNLCLIRVSLCWIVSVMSTHAHSPAVHMDETPAVHEQTDYINNMSEQHHGTTSKNSGDSTSVSPGGTQDDMSLVSITGYLAEVT
jgi:hypothetical protein